MEENGVTGAAESTQRNPYFDRPRRAALGDGWNWIKSGFTLFLKDAWLWVGITLVFMLIMMMLGALPLVSLLATVLSPVFIAGIMMGCRDAAQGNGLTLNHLFKGFSHNTKKLVGAGALYLLLTFALMVPMFILALVMGLSADSQPTLAAFSLLGLAVMLLVTLLIMVPLLMAYYFVPTLLALNPELGVIESFKISLLGCWANILPFSLYAIVFVLLSMIAIIPLGLGLLVLFPVVFCSMYCAYRNIYGTE